MTACPTCGQHYDPLADPPPPVGVIRCPECHPLAEESA